MFDKQYFENHFKTQYEQLGLARGSVFLHDATEFKIARVDQALDGYVLMQVFSQDGVNDKTRQEHRIPGASDKVYWDRVAVAYGSISYVRLSVTDPEEETRIQGFGRQDGPCQPILDRMAVPFAGGRERHLCAGGTDSSPNSLVLGGDGRSSPEFRAWGRL